jgi:hypothetical protein
MFDTTLARIITEIVSAVICFILVKFMMKPYQLTRESRYLGLPFGFGFLGASYVISAIVYYSKPNIFYTDLLWFQSLTRTFAFVFLAMTYYFSKRPSKRPSKNPDLLSGAAFSILIVAVVALFLVVFIAPQVASHFYSESQVYVRIFNVLCLAYIAIHTLRSHIKKPDPTTIWIPLGFMLLGISQYSLLFWYTDTSYAAFTGAIALRLAGLVVFLSFLSNLLQLRDERG